MLLETLYGLLVVIAAIAGRSGAFTHGMSLRASTRSSPLPEYKAVVVGSGGVGKSCLTIQLVQHQFYEDYDPTIEDSYRHKTTIDGEQSVLDILDTAGQEEYAMMLDQYLSGGDGFLLVYSITSRKSFEEIKNLHKRIQNVKEHKKRIAMVLVGNKCDLEKDREVSESEGRALARRWAVPFYETSAKRRTHVEDSFFELAREVKRLRLAETAGEETNKLKLMWRSFRSWLSNKWRRVRRKDKPKRRTENRLKSAASARSSVRASSKRSGGRGRSAAGRSASARSGR